MQQITQEIATVQSEYLYDLLQRIKQRPGMYLSKVVSGIFDKKADDGI